MIVDAGKLDRVLELLARTVTRDAAGQPIETWTVTATVHAQRLTLRAADLRSSAGVETVPDGKYLIRWRAGVSTANRVRVDEREFTVLAVDEPDRRQSLTLTVQGV